MRRVVEPDSPLYQEFQQLSQNLRSQIIAIRHQKGLTQEDMQSAGVSLRQYQRIESGETENITLANLFRIARAFNVSLSQLLALAEKSEPDAG